MIKLLSSVAGSPYFLYMKLAAAAVVLAGVGWASWQVRALIAKDDEVKAVNAAVEKVGAELATERKLRALAETRADKEFAQLLQLISNIKVEHKTITNNVTKEREIHKEFYIQPLPEGGYEQWKRARALLGASSASSPRP